MFVHVSAALKEMILAPLMACLCVLLSAGGAGGKGVWGAAGMVYEDEEPDARDPNYDESAQVGDYDRLCLFQVWWHI